MAEPWTTRWVTRMKREAHMCDACVSDEMCDLVGHIARVSQGAHHQTSIQIALQSWRTCLDKIRPTKLEAITIARSATTEEMYSTKPSRDHFQNVPEPLRSVEADLQSCLQRVHEFLRTCRLRPFVGVCCRIRPFVGVCSSNSSDRRTTSRVERKASMWVNG